MAMFKFMHTLNILELKNEDILGLHQALVDEAKFRGLKLPPEIVAVPDLTEVEKAYCESGRKITAIKEVRARLGVGLRDAKDLVDAYSLAWEKQGKPVGGIPKSW